MHTKVILSYEETSHKIKKVSDYFTRTVLNIFMQCTETLFVFSCTFAVSFAVSNDFTMTMIIPGIFVTLQSTKCFYFVHTLARAGFFFPFQDFHKSLMKKIENRLIIILLILWRIPSWLRIKCWRSVHYLKKRNEFLKVSIKCKWC